MLKRCDIGPRQMVLDVEKQLCTDKRELLVSDVFARVVATYCGHLRAKGSPLIDVVAGMEGTDAGWRDLVRLLQMLADTPLDEAVRHTPRWSALAQTARRHELHAFVEGLYDYWRSFDRYVVLHSEPGPSGFDQRPYRSFNLTVENLTHIIRALYRDTCENITGDHPRIYRQVEAGCNVALIALRQDSGLPDPYRRLLGEIPLVRQVWMAPPLIIAPPYNKRTGEFERVAENPLSGMALDPSEWLCFPARVGPVVVFVYFHRKFMGLGCSLANLFELADDVHIRTQPQAIYVYGAPAGYMARFGELPTVFYEDDENDLLVGAVPDEDRFGYFGYLKKMILTLHNIAMMQRGRMPFHGAMTRISLRDGHAANILIIGDTATGKSEMLEAFRILGGEQVRGLTVVADDMGSLEVTDDGRILAYGTETGAFIRLDDLQQGYVFAQVDRAIIMSPQKPNARVVVPVTTLECVLRGHPVDILLYANNYENVDAEHPALERFATAEDALAVFRNGAAMAKGTTTASGLVHSYFANVFGPSQYRELHEALARRVFDVAVAGGVYVGQIRTRLGVKGMESEGPREAAKALFEVMTTSPVAPPAAA